MKRLTTDKSSWIKEEIKSLKRQGLYINIRTIESPVEAHIKVNGRNVLNFCSNNYLGLANNPSLKKAAKVAIDKYGIGPAAVRTIAGTTSLHLALEDRLVKFKKVAAAITFQSGFNANLATIPALVGDGDIIFSDELNHASIIDGARLSKAKVVRYAHANAGDLEKKLSSKGRSASGRRKLVVTDGVFSMDGDIAPLNELYKVAQKVSAYLMVDDAHGEGVLGQAGRGIVDYFNLHGKVDIEVGTMSKAFGVVGGFVAGKKEIVSFLRQKARPFLFSSAMTIPDVAACIAALNILEKSGNLVKKLWNNTKNFKENMVKLGFDIGKSQTPIVPVMLGEAPLAQKFSQKLFEQGVFAMAIGYPTVPKGAARIRVMVSASHLRKDLEKAIGTFRKVGKELGVI